MLDLICVAGLLLPCTSAFSLADRRLSGMTEVVSDPSCATSCDELYNEDCDAVDGEGEYTLGCDMHPTAGCDDFSGCHSPPAPPRRPVWTGTGTYPHAPPPPSPPDVAPAVFSALLLFLAVVLVAGAVVVGVFQCYGAGSRVGFCLWQCCGWWLWACPRNMDEATEFGNGRRVREARRRAETKVESVCGEDRLTPNLSALSDSAIAE